MESLFTYGTLQDRTIQKAVFGKLLTGKTDSLPGYEKFQLKIPDSRSGSSYPALRISENKESKVHGTVYLIDEKDLILADGYEGYSYVRKKLKLDSGIEAWTYVSRK